MEQDSVFLQVVGKLLDVASRSDVDCVIGVIKNPDLIKLLHHASSLSQPENPQQRELRQDENLEIWLSNQLLVLGFKFKTLGCRYIIDAVSLYLELPGSLITKDIYPEVAKRHNTTPPKVERAIRHIIGSCHNKHPDIWKTILKIADRPANGDFIATLAELSRFRF